MEEEGVQQLAVGNLECTFGIDYNLSAQEMYEGAGEIHWRRSSVVEQGTHKPLVVRSTRTVATLFRSCALQKQDDIVILLSI